MIFRNARLIFPDGVRDRLEIIESGGKICDIRSADRSGEADGFDAGGNFLAPGFVDLHVHGAVGRDTMEGTADAFRAICNYHASGGTTTLCLTTATAPIDEIIAVLRAAREARVMIHLEGPFISPARPGAQNAEFIREPDAASVDRLLEFADVTKRVTIAPEVRGAIEAIARFHECGIAVSGGHSDAWDEDAQRAFAAGMREVTHTFNCMSSARKRGDRRVAGLLEFALSEPEITCELIADGHHVSPTLMKMLYRAKGAAGICLVTDATAGAGLPNESHFTLAGHDCVVADAACWLADRSALAGSAARMIDCVRTIARDVGLPLNEVITMATANPARALGLTTKGKLEVGYDADFVVFSPDFEVAQTFVAGEQVFSARATK
ncbi:MAG: N-acetylglucosamine-6-phosphate deacetylase [Chthoniobacterales bacterium]